MGITELTGRFWQGTSKWLDRVGVARRTNSQDGDLDRAARMLLDRLRETDPYRFFEGVVSEQTPTLCAKQMPKTWEQTMATADAVYQRHFDLLGYRGLSFGDPVDWHADPISGCRAPLVHWSCLNPLNSAIVGDSKVIWELNRHQWLVYLGQAYRLTGDERYAEVFPVAVREWMQANPPGIGINWASSLEVSLRLISWCWALFLFRESGTLSPEFLKDILGGIWTHASHVERFLSYYFSPNTHLTGEALGLFYAGVLFPELQSAERWRMLGTQILVEQSERQIFPDGVYFEQSTCYQRYTVEIYLHLLILAARNGVAIPDVVGERVQRMLDFLLAIHRSNGSIPQIGDADGGCLLPLTSRAPDDFRGVFSSAAAFFSRSDYAWVAGRPAPETLWLLGAAGLKAFEALHPAPQVMAPSRIFADGGYAVMRSGWKPDAPQLIFDVGPLGCPVSGGHGHADLLSIQCSVFGEPFLVDPGMYCYTAEPNWRDFFRSTAAHSTIRLDNAEQAVPTGPFRWKMRPRARLRQWLSTDVYDFADADHDAYRCLSDPVTHRRRVVFVKPCYWIIVDDLEGAAEHRVELRFQFAPMTVTLDSTLWARAHRSKGCGLFIRSFTTVPLTATIIEGALNPIQGWVAPDYGQRRPAPVLIYSTVTRLPLRIVTLLLPTENPFAHPPTVSPLIGEDTEPVGLIFGDGRKVIICGERDIVVEQR
jgi:hypothetical protein